MVASKVKKLFFCGGKSFRSNQVEREEEEEEEEGQLPEGGRIRVWVGMAPSSQRKLDVEAGFLNHPLFRDLLRASEDEFGYSYSGALRIACDADHFLHLLHLLRSGDPAVRPLHFGALPPPRQLSAEPATCISTNR